MTSYTERTFTLRERFADWLTGGTLTAIEKERQREEVRANTAMQLQIATEGHLYHYMMRAGISMADPTGNAKDITPQDRSITAPTSGC